MAFRIQYANISYSVICQYSVDWLFLFTNNLKKQKIMPFWKKNFHSRAAVYYPQTIVQGKPVETETIAKDLAEISTVSRTYRPYWETSSV